MANLRDFKVDDNGDLVIDGGEIATVDGYDEVAQNVRTILSTELGTSFLAEELGTNYESIMGKDFNEQFAEQDIEDAITEQEVRVTSVDDVTFYLDPETRNLSVTLNLQVDLNQSGESKDYEMEVDMDATN
ncbi:DUF2634 domain-containing protein [Lactiplantibacillus xiangfangensis]|uniref:DUF2634 domain-containing protein n=1 Tax=Lactiplantibacillus xiangfangensis TaxID=942150 RepID=UPI00384B983E